MVSELARGWRPDSDNAAIAALRLPVLVIAPATGRYDDHVGGQCTYVVRSETPDVLLCWRHPSTSIRPAASFGVRRSCAARCYRSPSRHFGRPDCGWPVRWWRSRRWTFCGFHPTYSRIWPGTRSSPCRSSWRPWCWLWVVALGGVRWWPVLVFVASVAAQSHLTFVIPSVVLTLTALIFGLQAVRLRRLGWLITGVGVGLVCWLAPLLQEVGHGPGQFVCPGTIERRRNDRGLRLRPDCDCWARPGRCIRSGLPISRRRSTPYSAWRTRTPPGSGD